MSYLNKVTQEESKVVAIDFDGVIHSFEHGFHDGTIYGTPLPGAQKALEYFSTNYTIILFTAKAKPDRPLVNGKTGVELVWEWLKKYNLDSYIHQITAEKPRAICYIDDKGIRFTNWEQTLTDFKTYYE